MSIPKRIKKYTGRFALVDNIPYELPVQTKGSPCMMSGYTCDFEEAKKLMPHELEPLKLPNGKAVFLATIIDYTKTNIGDYVEYSLAIACKRKIGFFKILFKALITGKLHLGQYIVDLPVSSDVSVKGGKGIWGMPKHKANLDFKVTDSMVSSQYEKDGQFAFRVEMERPKGHSIKLKLAATNFSIFRNMLMASYIFFESKFKFNLFKKAKGALYIGDHPKVAGLKGLNITSDPFFTMYMANTVGVLDDYYESWFVTYDKMPEVMPEGLEAVVDLGLSEEWLPAPSVTDFQKYKV